MFSGSSSDYSSFKKKHLHLRRPGVNSTYGKVHYNFSETFSTKFDNELNEHGCFVSDASYNVLLEALQNFSYATSHGLKSLFDYSPWLATYKSTNFGSSQLKLPVHRNQGKKDGNINLLQVEAFKDDITFMNSKQLPVRVTFIGLLANIVLLHSWINLRF